MTPAAPTGIVPILIVEDEPLIRMLAADIAAQEGFAVWEAQDADRAMDVLGKTDGIRLVFTDIDMPGSQDGLALAATIQKRWPAIRLVITSGKLRPDESEMPAGSLFLPKPYTTSALVQALDPAWTPVEME